MSREEARELGGSAMVDRLRLLVAVNMLAPPTTTGVAKRLGVSRDEAESALQDAEGVHWSLNSDARGCSGPEAPGVYRCGGLATKVALRCIGCFTPIRGLPPLR